MVRSCNPAAWLNRNDQHPSDKVVGGLNPSPLELGLCLSRGSQGALGAQISHALPATVSLSIRDACPTRLHRIPEDTLAVSRLKRARLPHIEAPRSHAQSRLIKKKQFQRVSVAAHVLCSEPSGRRRRLRFIQRMASKNGDGVGWTSTRRRRSIVPQEGKC